MIKSDAYDPKLSDTYDYSYEAGKFRKFLWFCSGTDVQLLNRCPHSERVKAEGIGGVILATAGLAFLSGSYAFYTVFGPKVNFALTPEQQQIDPWTFILAIICGLVWALVIFNLDRFIVTSTGHGDGTEKITKEELKSGLPRIVMAVFIGICLSAPLETRVFKSEIEARLDYLQEQKAKENDAPAIEKFNSYKIKYEKEMLELVKDKDALVNQKNDLIKSHADAVSAKREEMRDKDRPGFGPRAKQLEIDLVRAKDAMDAAVPQLEIQIKQKNDRIDSINLEIKKGLDEKTAYHAKSQLRAANIDGLGRRIELAHQLFPFTSAILMLLLIIIEVTPIFIKMMFVRGPYDLLVENQNRIVSAKYGIEERPILESDSELSAHGVVEPKFHQAKLIEEYERSALDAEKELSKIAHEEFLEKTKKDIKKNPEKYFVEKN